MSIVDALKNGQRTMIANTGNVTVTGGDGHSKMRITGENVKIDTGCGDQDIEVIASGDLDIDTGLCGEDTITALVAGDAKVVTREDNDEINMYVGGTFQVNAGMVHPNCGAEEDDDKVTIVSNATSGSNFVAVGQGNDTVNLIANNVDVKKADGSLELGFIGSGYNINSEAKSNFIAGWGDDVTMNLRVDNKANNRVYTFDQLWGDEDESISNKFQTGFWQTDNSMVTSLTLPNGEEINFVNAMGQIIETRNYTEKTVEVQEEILDTKSEVSVTESVTGGASIKDIAKKYGFNEKQLSKYDFSETLKDGSPRYIILGRQGGKFYQLADRSGQKSGSAKVVANSEGALGSTLVRVKVGKKYVTQIKDLTKIGEVISYANSNVKDLSIDGEVTKTTTTTTTKTDTVKTTTKTTEKEVEERLFDGVSDWTINAGDGKLTGHITHSGDVTVNYGEACNNCQVKDIVITNGYITKTVLNENTKVDVKTEDKVTTKVDTKSEKIAAALKLLQKTVVSPLVLDMNKDGKVSAAAGKGVDLNNNGIADGAATGGDKMLAMTDLNGNGKIDGAEVFGDKTVSPFSGKAINAANGFEALKQVAQEAKQYTGIDCMNGTKVDVQKLQQALAKVGVNLGFISDDNVTNLENLYGVSQIEVSDYKQTGRTGAAVEHLQQGSYVDENGVEFKVDDIWFEEF